MDQRVSGPPDPAGLWAWRPGEEPRLLLPEHVDAVLPHSAGGLVVAADGVVRVLGEP